MGFFDTLSGKPKKTFASNSNVEKELANILVKDVMSRQLIVAQSSTTIYQISKMMEQGIGSVLVKKDSTPTGIITDRDFAIKIVANKYPLDTPVDKIASSPLLTIDSHESILDAAKQMSAKKIRKLVVVENNKVIGIITSTDLTNQLALIKNKLS